MIHRSTFFLTSRQSPQNTRGNLSTLQTGNPVISHPAQTHAAKQVVELKMDSSCLPQHSTIAWTVACHTASHPGPPAVGKLSLLLKAVCVCRCVFDSEDWADEVQTEAHVQAYMDVNLGYSAFRIICDSPYTEVHWQDGRSYVSFANGDDLFQPQVPVTEVREDYHSSRVAAVTAKHGWSCDKCSLGR